MLHEHTVQEGCCLLLKHCQDGYADRGRFAGLSTSFPLLDMVYFVELDGSKLSRLVCRAEWMVTLPRSTVRFLPTDSEART